MKTLVARRPAAWRGQRLVDERADLFLEGPFVVRQGKVHVRAGA